MHLIVITGPIAVGKMTVGRELSQRTGYPLFHNHMTVEPLVGIFAFGSESYGRLTTAIRSMIISEAVRAELPGLIMTIVVDFDDPADLQWLAERVDPVTTAGGTVDYVELIADQTTRLAREGTPLRLEHKATKRDVESARRVLRMVDENARTTSQGDFPLAGRHVLIDNTELSPGLVAEQVIEQLDLPTR